jgi:hypothetical protein
MSYKIQEDAHDRLTVIHEDSKWPKWIVFLALMISMLLIFHLSKDPVDKEKIIGCVIAILMLGFSYLIVYEKSVFVFDCRDRLIHWSRKRVFSHRQETITFDNVKFILSQASFGSSRNPGRRVALLTDRGLIPISTAYFSDSNDGCGKLAVRLRDMLGISNADSDSDSVLDTVRGLVADGQKIEAIRFFRQHKNMSLKEAKDAVEKLMKNQ